MLDLDLRLVRYFISVGERENISAAARELNLTQPALSRAIRSLEDQLGWKLLERKKKSVTLTREGEIFLREARKLSRAAEQTLLRAKREIEGVELRIGFAPSLAAGLVDKALGKFTARWPKVQLSWSDLSTREMCEKLAADEIDLILEVATSDPQIHWTQLRQKQMRLLVPPKAPDVVSPEALDGQRLLLLNRHDYPGYWEKVTHYFTEHQINAKVAGEFDGISSLSMGVEAGLGWALISEGARVSDSLKVAQLSPAPAPLCIAVGARAGRELNPWETDLIEMLKL